MKKIIINLFIIVFIIFLTDFIFSLVEYRNFYLNFYNRLKERNTFTEEEAKTPPLPYKYSLRIMHIKDYWNKYIVPEISTPKRIIEADNNKKSVIVFGCSFAEGSRLKPNENFEYKLSNMTNRTVYNRGVGGFGLSEAVYLTKYNGFYKDIKIPPEYIIYVYIPDHIRRIYADKYGLDKHVYVSYENQNGILTEKNPLDIQLSRLYMYKAYKNNQIMNFINNSDKFDEQFDTMKLYFKEMKRELEVRYPNNKFIIIKYPFLASFYRNSLNYCYLTDRWKELEQDGFIIYDLKEKIKVDLIGEEYTVFDGHPNSKAWDIITEQLLKDYPALY